MKRTVSLELSNTCDSAIHDLAIPHIELLLRTTKGLLEIIPVIGQHIVTVISQQSIKNLDPVQTIPRLYRRTNREV